MFWDVFFMDQDPDFSGSDPYFWPIRTWTQKKKSDPDPKKNPDPKLWAPGPWTQSQSRPKKRPLHNTSPDYTFF